MSDSLWSMDCSLPWNSPGKNTGVGSHSLRQGIFPTQGSKLGLLLCRQILYHLIHWGSPHSTGCPQALYVLRLSTDILEWIERLSWTFMHFGVNGQSWTLYGPFLTSHSMLKWKFLLLNTDIHRDKVNDTLHFIFRRRVHFFPSGNKYIPDSLPFGVERQKGVKIK